MTIYCRRGICTIYRPNKKSKKKGWTYTTKIQLLWVIPTRSHWRRIVVYCEIKFESNDKSSRWKKHSEPESVESALLTLL